MRRAVGGDEQVGVVGAVVFDAPVLLYYAMVSLANTLSVMGPDIEATAGMGASDPKTIKAYMKVMDELLFKGGKA